MDLDNLQLRAQVAVVTGGSRGIGKAIVELLAACGARVVVNYVKDQEAAEATVSVAQGRGAEAIAVKANVANLPEAQRLIDATISRFKRIDILVCNAESGKVLRSTK